MDEFINLSHVFINDISRYIATFCDLKKRKKVLLFCSVFLSLHCPRHALDLKTEDCFK